mmetsp:Transcript_9855/g.20619  ORF Transcript_9855/g.20619 Transcript_9855/m.20619 type:complete len:253 (-) Transcript_9855:581-1339(-)
MKPHWCACLGENVSKTRTPARNTLATAPRIDPASTVKAGSRAPSKITTAPVTKTMTASTVACVSRNTMRRKPKRRVCLPNKPIACAKPILAVTTVNSSANLSSASTDLPVDSRRPKTSPMPTTRRKVGPFATARTTTTRDASARLPSKNVREPLAWNACMVDLASDLSMTVTATSTLATVPPAEREPFAKWSTLTRRRRHRQRQILVETATLAAPIRTRACLLPTCRRAKVRHPSSSFPSSSRHFFLSYRSP